MRINLQWHRLKVGLVAIEGRIDKSILEHEAIASAILEKDPEKARSTMVEHLDDLKKFILKLMSAFNFSN
jgi:DNA-binding GntR family transcriptional regulator